ncbi:MAG TPA: cytochrome b/b6 domain-containing protein [Burkholderiaceae bacterium]|nr:cytochrome b/b6 domain-containing protein [Burkholderiaceae bacterium]
MPTAAVPVWDRVVRLAHWTLVASVALAWLSTIAALSGIGAWHQPVGYAALVAVLARVLWGIVGPNRYARFAQFVRAPRATWAYVREVLAHREPRYLGHNPLGAWMIVALMACVLGLALTGWLYTTDRFWGDETVETAHEVLAWTLLGLAALHVAGVVYTSFRQRENLVRAMLSGTKAAPRDRDIA